jgi:hypothetical protein
LKRHWDNGDIDEENDEESMVLKKRKIGVPHVDLARLQKKRR